VDNPFDGATTYVNSDYSALVDGSVEQTTDPDLRARMRTVRDYPTAVWLDRIAAIEGGADNGGRLGLAEHLDAALDQQQGDMPVLVPIVIYDLPGRDCAALASSGELPLTDDGLARYKNAYIDAIADIAADPAYAGVRIVAVHEPDGLPNLVTNLSDPECAQAKSSGIQVEAVRYALDTLHAIPNVYNYLDIAHSGWLGWDDNLTRTVQLYTEVVAATAAGFASVDGIATNTSNNTPIEEPFLPDPALTIGGQPVGSGTYYEWNPRFDEADYTAALHLAFTAAGWPDTLGAIVDTSRNGWGGADRPTAPSTSTNLDDYVAESKVDQREHRGLWCNHVGTGLGARPQASPAGFPESHIDAFVWVKPPGESDGASEDIPNNEGKRPDPMCDPEYHAPNAGGHLTGAMPDAPLAGHWFPAQFAELVANAYPEVPASTEPADHAGPRPAADADWLTTEGNKIVDADGDAVRLSGTNWFGFNATERVFHGLWSANIETITKGMADRGINIVRVPISTQLVLEWRDGQATVPSAVNTWENPELAGMTTLEVWDHWLALCARYGIKVLVDVHSAEADNSGHLYPLWYKGSITPELFYQAWEWLATRYLDDDTVVAMDIKNEPHGKQAESPRAKWDGSSDEDNYKNACETAGRRILAINPRVLILCEGIEIYPKDGASWSSTAEEDYDFTWWGGNLRGAADHPVDLGAHHQLVYSPHDYGPLVYEQPWFQKPFDKATLTEDVWRPNWLYLHENNTAPLLVGEWGGRLGQDARQDKWLLALRDLIVENGLHQTFWCLNPNSGDTGGLLLDDWKTWDEQKYAMLKPALWQYDGKFVSLDHTVPLGGEDSTTGISLDQRYP
jgi:cellulase/cellobiase CelA1